MIKLDLPHRRATLDDAAAMAEFVNIAGEGLPFYLWTQSAEPGQSPWEVGWERARREEGAFSYRNTILREENGKPAACLIGYPLADEVQPPDYSAIPPMFVPMQQLEDQAPGTWYVNVLASFPEHRGKGYGAELLALAEQLAVNEKKSALSIIVSDANTGARRLYERVGFRETARRPMIKDSWEHAGKDWVLLIKPVS
ncbi:MAG: GNAT family N-acetyltransferase [Cellvibrionaceae bacterium]